MKVEFKLTNATEPFDGIVSTHNINVPVPVPKYDKKKQKRVASKLGVDVSTVRIVDLPEKRRGYNAYYDDGGK